MGSRPARCVYNILIPKKMSCFLFFECFIITLLALFGCEERDFFFKASFLIFITDTVHENS